MQVRRILSLVLVIMVLCYGGQLVLADSPMIVEEKLAENAYVQILPRVELLAGVLSQTSWMDSRGPKGKGNEYFRELQSFFEPYKDHQAIKIAEKLTKRHFTYDAPVQFILRLGPLPDLEATYGYNDYLIGRAGSEKILEEFRGALVELAHISQFDQFFAQHMNLFKESIGTTTSGFQCDTIMSWLEEFFGWSGNEYYMVLAPAMFPGGGYGSQIFKENDEMIVYQVIREKGSSTTQPEFSTADRLDRLALHEWGHSFVNPSTAKYPEKVKRLKPLFNKVKQKIMRQTAYNGVEIFLNEQILRAMEGIVVRDLMGEVEYEKHIRRQNEIGFYLTEYTIEQLDQYREMRGEYPRFDQYLPVLLDQYYADMESFTPRTWWQKVWDWIWPF